MAKKQNADDAIQMLTADHRRVQQLFDQFEEVDRDDYETLAEIVETACMELQLHAMLEEEIFYPAVRAGRDDRDINDVLNEAEVEHEAAHELIAKLQDLEPDDEMYLAHFVVLSEYVTHHVQEEERDLFPAVRKLGLDLTRLANEMRTRREELIAELESEDADLDTEEDDEALGDDDDAVASADEEVGDEQEEIAPGRRH